MDLLTSSWGMALVMSAIAAGLPYIPDNVMKFMNIVVCSTSFGTQFWVFLIAGLTMFGTLTRRTFGRVQSKLFPKYATLNTSCSLIAFGTYFHLNNLGHTGSFFKVCEKWEGLMLVYGLLANISNSLYFIPVTTRLTFEVHTREIVLGLEDRVGERSPLRKSDKATDEDKAVLKKFYIIHGISMLMSLIAMGTCGAYLYSVSKTLKF